MMNKTKKLPLRQCIACRTQKPKRELLRIVRTPDSELLFDNRGKLSGRGAYLCVSSECLKKTVKNKLFKRHLDAEPDAALLSQLEGLISDDIQD